MERWRAKKFAIEASLPEALNNPGCNLLRVAVDCHFAHCGLSRRLMMINDRLSARCRICARDRCLALLDDPLRFGNCLIGARDLGAQSRERRAGITNGLATFGDRCPSMAHGARKLFQGAILSQHPCHATANALGCINRCETLFDRWSGPS